MQDTICGLGLRHTARPIPLDPAAPAAVENTRMQSLSIVRVGPLVEVSA